MSTTQYLFRGLSRLGTSLLRPAGISGHIAPRALQNYGQPHKVARYATTPGAGNPEIVETLPSTADEVKPPGSTTPPNGHGNGNGNGTGAALPEASGDGSTDWSKSYFGLSTQPFSKEISEILMRPIEYNDIEMKPGTSFALIRKV